MMQLLAIARNAFLEMVRQPIFGAMILVTFAVLIADVPLSSWTMGGETAQYKKTDQQLLVNLGMSTLLISGLLVAAFGASGVVSREIRDRTILTVVSKPLSRATVVIGKYVGVAAAVTLAFGVCTVGFLLTVRHGVLPSVSDPVDWPVIVLGLGALATALLAAMFCNWSFRWHFVSSFVMFSAVLMTAALMVVSFFGKHWEASPIGLELPFNLPHALVLMWLSNLVFAAVAVAASTRLGQAMTLLTCVGFFLVGLWGSSLLGSPGGSAAMQFLRGAVPDLKFFYVLDALIREKAISLTYIGWAVLYDLFLILATLSIGVILFQTRELEQTSSGGPMGVSLMAVLGRFGAILLLLAAIKAFRGGGMGRIFVGPALVAGSVAAWVLWGWFGRGVKWTYFVALLVLLAAAGGAGAALLGYSRLATLNVPLLVTTAVGATLCVLILVLPKTRFHFDLVRLPARARKAGEGR